MNYKETIRFSDEITEIFWRLVEAQNEGLCTIFFDYSGHVNSLIVCLTAPSWGQDSQTPTYREHIYIDEDFTQADIDAFAARIDGQILALKQNLHTTKTAEHENTLL